MKEKIVNILESLNIPYEICNFKSHALGMCTPDMIYLSNRLWLAPTHIQLYCALHEIAHYKRLEKIDDTELNEFVETNDFDDFMSFVKKEERIADRFAHFWYYQLEKEHFPENINTSENESELAMYRELFDMAQESDKSLRDIVKEQTV